MAEGSGSATSSRGASHYAVIRSVGPGWILLAGEGAVGVRLSRRRGTSVTQPPQFGGPNPIDGPANPAPQYDGPQFGGPAPVGAPQPDPHGPPPNFVQSPQQPGWPNQFGGQPQQYQQFGQPPAAPQQNRKALIVTGVATGVVLLVVAVVVGIVTVSLHI